MSYPLSDYARTSSFLQEKSIQEISGERRIYQVFPEDMILNIFSQVLCTLHFLQNRTCFYSGGIDASTFFITEKPIKFTYGKIPVDSPVTLKLDGFNNSCLTYNLTSEKTPYRIYNRQWLGVIYENLIQDQGDFYYIPSQLTEKGFTQIMAYDSQPYLSFDTYAAWIFLLSHPSIHYSVFASEKLQKKLWEPLWLQTDAMSMYYKLQKLMHQSRITFSDVYRLLLEVRLSKNLTNMLLQKIC